MTGAASQWGHRRSDHACRPPCSVAYEPQLNAKGERLAWLEPPKAERAIAELSALARRLATLTASSNLRGWRKAQRSFLVNGICNLHLHRNGVARKRLKACFEIIFVNDRGAEVLVSH